MGLVKLNIPYRSQWADDAKNHETDCGPTCVAMILNGVGISSTPDGLYQHIPGKGYSDYTNFIELRKAAEAKGLQLKRC